MTFKVDDMVKAFDFQPEAGRPDKYLTGTVEWIDTRDGMLHVRCGRDTMIKNPERNRVGKIVMVPISLMEWDEYEGRVTRLV